MSKATVCVAFICGAAVGAGCTWQYFKKKYESQVQEDIESVKESFAKRYEKKAAEVPEESDIQSANEVDQQGELDAGYIEAGHIVETMGYAPDGSPTEPYVISPHEFGEKDGYECIGLTYHADGIVTDDANEVLDNWPDLVGPDFMSHFGEYEDDSVFVRNEDRQTDYEILRDLSPFHAPED